MAHLIRKALSAALTNVGLFYSQSGLTGSTIAAIIRSAPATYLITKIAFMYHF